MKIFLFGEFNKDNILKLCPAVTAIESAVLRDYFICCDANGRGFLKKAQGAVAEGFFAECMAEDIWKLDQWKNVLALCKKEIEDVGGFSYFSIYDGEGEDNAFFASEESIDTFVCRIGAHGSIKRSDVHLLIPGSTDTDFEKIPQAFLGKLLQDSITEVNSKEYKSDFLKDCDRYALGRIAVLGYGDTVQNAVLTVMKHKMTGLCVVDIFIPAATESTHEILEAYRGNELIVEYRGERFDIEGVCRRIGVDIHGSPRSLVFAYEELSLVQRINLLANECTPMGNIVGEHFEKLATENIAQYDTAKVYVSPVTMLEMTDAIDNDIFSRIRSQAIEIFFVEMLLLQDAAVSKMYGRVKKEIELERFSKARKDADKIIGELINDTTYALNFADYQQFYFPTVMVSAERIAKAFGIDRIHEKFEQNRKLLENMIAGHKAEIDKKENAIKNNLLAVLTVLSGISTVYGFFTLLKDGNLWLYVAMSVVMLGIAMYFGVSAHLRRKANKRNQRNDK